MTVPETLKKNQFWFGSVIQQPLDDNCIQHMSPSGRPIAVEAAGFIAPSPTLEPWQRMEIYNQQYWWRLLKILQSTYPILARIFGYQDFNKSIAVPYLVKYPSEHWSVDHLGDRLPKWILEDYHAEDRELVFNTASVDFAISNAFALKNGEPLHALQLDRPIYLQPWISLFTLPYDLLEFRKDLLKEEVEHWEQNEFPKLLKEKETYYFVIWRNAANHVVWDYLNEAEYLVLKTFEPGSTLEKTCEWLENQDQGLCDLAMQNIHHWFQEWTLRNWLTLTQAEK